MNQQRGCRHEWVKHGDRSFYCGTCGYFAETLEEWLALLKNEQKSILSEVEKIVDEVNCPHCKEQVRHKLHDII